MMKMMHQKQTQSYQADQKVCSDRCRSYTTKTIVAVDGIATVRY